MTLRWRILGILGVVILLNAVLSYGILRLVVFPGFLALERTEAEEDLTRCIEALHREIHHLDTVARDWAAWDDTYRLVQNSNTGYVQSNHIPHTFSDNRLNIIYICDVHGQLVWGEIRDWKTNERISLSEFPASGLSSNHVLLRHEDSESGVAGILLTERGPLMVASRPIITSDHQGPVQGFLIMGRFITDEVVRTLAEQTRVAHRIRPVPSTPTPAEQDILNQVASGDGVAVVEPKGDRLHVYAAYPDLAGRPALLLRADIPRNIRSRGVTTLGVALLSVCAAGLLMVGILLILLRSSIVKPLTLLTERIHSFPDPDKAIPPVLLERKDEIGALCREFDHTLRKLNRICEGLETTNQTLRHEVQARKRSEGEARLGRRRLREATAELLLTEERERRRIATELHDQIGQTLAIIKMKLGMVVQLQIPGCRSNEVETIQELLDQVIQDARTLTFELSPPVLYELGLEAAVRWLTGQLREQHGIRIQVHDDRRPKPLADDVRVLVFQAVRELLLNAVKHSKADQVDVRIQRDEDHLRIEIHDDGVGFDPAEVSVQTNQNAGFGLFSIRERLVPLGGRFEIDSKPGKGTYILLLTPLESDIETDTKDGYHENPSNFGG